MLKKVERRANDVLSYEEEMKALSDDGFNITLFIDGVKVIEKLIDYVKWSKQC